MPYLLVRWQVFDVIPFSFLLPQLSFGCPPLCMSILFSLWGKTGGEREHFSLRRSHSVLLSSSFYSLWSGVLIGLGVIFLFLIKPPENSSSSWNSGDQTHSPAHWVFHAAAFHLRIGLLKDTWANGRTCTCVCVRVGPKLQQGHAKDFQSDNSRPLYSKCSPGLTQDFFHRDEALWGWVSNISSFPPAWRESNKKPYVLCSCFCFVCIGRWRRGGFERMCMWSVQMCVSVYIGKLAASFLPHW